MNAKNKLDKELCSDNRAGVRHKLIINQHVKNAFGDWLHGGFQTGQNEQAFMKICAKLSCEPQHQRAKVMVQLRTFSNLSLWPSLRPSLRPSLWPSLLLPWVQVVLQVRRGVLVELAAKERAQVQLRQWVQGPRPLLQERVPHLARMHPTLLLHLQL